MGEVERISRRDAVSNIESRRSSLNMDRSLARTDLTNRLARMRLAARQAPRPPAPVAPAPPAKGPCDDVFDTCQPSDCMYSQIKFVYCKKTCNVPPPPGVTC